MAEETKAPVQDAQEAQEGIKEVKAGQAKEEASAAEDIEDITLEEGNGAKQAAGEADSGAQAEPGAEAEAEPEAEAGPGGAGEKEKKEGLFKKKKKSKEQEKIEELTDQVKRQMAEFDNFRKRTEKEKAQMFETGAKSIIEKILPVVDNFERGLDALTEEEKKAPFVEGMEKVYKQMMTVLEEAGVTVIEAQGKEFDPNLHNAVMHIEDESLGENVVAAELQKGYLYRDSVVRHSMVQVAN